MGQKAEGMEHSAYRIGEGAECGSRKFEIGMIAKKKELIFGGRLIS